MEEKEKLYMPQGLNTNKEIIRGLEKESIGTLLMLFFLFNIINIIITIFIRNITFAVLYITISAMVSYMLVVKDNTGISVLDIIGFFFRFMNTQKKYSYMQKNEWRIDNEW